MNREKCKKIFDWITAFVLVLQVILIAFWIFSYQSRGIGELIDIGQIFTYFTGFSERGVGMIFNRVLHAAEWIMFGVNIFLVAGTKIKDIYKNRHALFSLILRITYISFTCIEGFFWFLLYCRL